MTAQQIEHYQFITKLKNLPFVEAIYLFGSRARGDNSPRSDIDIAISCPTASNQNWQQILNIIEDADTLLKIDCVRLDQVTDPELSDSIKKQHKILYLKEKQ